MKHIKEFNQFVNEATLINVDDVMSAQEIAGKTNLSYEESWDAITAYLVATMGMRKAEALVLKLEKEYNKIM